MIYDPFGRFRFSCAFTTNCGFKILLIMFCPVFSLCKQLRIRNIVIERIAVFVMDVIAVEDFAVAHIAIAYSVKRRKLFVAPSEYIQAPTD